MSDINTITTTSFSREDVLKENISVEEIVMILLVHIPIS